MPGAAIRLKRAYEAISAADGTRILVERLWPRGLAKADAAIDHWIKDIAPSTELRKWYDHQPERWPEFQERYRGELRENQPAVEHLVGLISEDRVTFIFAAKDEARNSAVVLKAFLEAEI